PGQSNQYAFGLRLALAGHQNLRILHGCLLPSCFLRRPLLYLKCRLLQQPRLYRKEEFFMSWILYRIGWSDISADERAKVLSKVEHIAALSPRTSPDQRI